MSYVYGIIKAVADTIAGLTPDETSLTDTSVRLDFADSYRWCTEDDAPETPDDAGGYDDRTFWVEVPEQSLDLTLGISTAALLDLPMAFTMVYAAGGDIRPYVKGIAQDDCARIQQMLWTKRAEGSITWPTGVSVSAFSTSDWRLVTRRGSECMLLTATILVRYTRTIS